MLWIINSRPGRSTPLFSIPRHSARCAPLPAHAAGTFKRCSELLPLECRRRGAAELPSPKRPDKPLTRQTGRLIQRLRRASGMSQEEFAAQCGLHRTYIGALERGEKTMTIETANNVAQTLGLTLGQFFTALEQMQDGRGAPPCADTNEQNGASDGQSGKQANPSNIR